MEFELKGAMKKYRRMRSLRRTGMAVIALGATFAPWLLDLGRTDTLICWLGASTALMTSELGIGRQLTAFRAAGSFPGILVSQRRSVAIIASIPADFPAHRRGRAAQQPSHRSCRSMDRNASRYLLAFRERQRQPLVTPGSWTNPTVR
jgi:hypothetical protein